jgi:hypothetical protein
MDKNTLNKGMYMYMDKNTLNKGMYMYMDKNTLNKGMYMDKNTLNKGKRDHEEKKHGDQIKLKTTYAYYSV